MIIKEEVSVRYCDFHEPGVRVLAIDVCYPSKKDVCPEHRHVKKLMYSKDLGGELSPFARAIDPSFVGELIIGLKIKNG